MPSDMRIVRLAIENFRSLEEAQIEFHPRVTVLIGRNNSGKSNVIDALGFLHSLTTSDGDGALSRRGGYGNIVYGHEERRTVKLVIELNGISQQTLVRELGAAGVPVDRMSKLDQKDRWALRYSLQIDHANFEEELDLKWHHEYSPIASGSYANGTYQPRFADFAKGVESIIAGQGFRTELPRASSSFSKDFRAGFRNASAPDLYLKFFIERLQRALSLLVTRVGPHRNPALTSSISGTKVLMEDGSNLADWLDYLRSNQPRQFREFVEGFAALVPEVRELATPRLGGPSTTVAIEEAWLPEGLSFDLSASSVGERHLMVILGRLLSSGSTLMVAIEEPENGIHPWAQRALARTIWRLSSERQILITTHSPAMFATFPLECLRLVRRELGASSVHDVDGSDTRLLANELGVKASDVLDQDIIVLVEGDTDEGVFSEWYATLRQSGKFAELETIRTSFLGVGGLTNIPLVLDARILQTRPVRPELSVITDGDVEAGAREHWRMVRRALPVPENRFLSLPRGRTIDNYLLVPTAISKAFSVYWASASEISEVRDESLQEKQTPKAALKSLFESKGLWYNPEVAASIARAMSVDEIGMEVVDLLLAIVRNSRA